MKIKYHKLGKLDILALVLGSIIGWGSFTLPGTTFLPQSGVLSTALAFFIGAVAMLFILYSYQYMMDYLKDKEEEGGEFSYVWQHLGRRHGFIVGWGLSLCYISLVPLNATAFVLVFKLLFGDVMSQGYLYDIAGYSVYLTDIAVATAILLVFSWINIRGIKLSATIQKILAFFLVIGVFSLVVMMFFQGERVQFFDAYIHHRGVTFIEMAPVLAIVPFLFVGFDVIPQVVLHLGFDGKTSIRLGAIGVFIGALAYASLNTIAALAFTPEEAPLKEWAVGEAVLTYVGPVGFVLLIIALAAAVTGGINGFMLASSKLLGALASYRMIPIVFSKKNDVGTGRPAILFITVISLIAPWFGREVISYIVDMCSVSAALTYFYVSFIAWREAPNTKGKVITGISAVISLGFMVLLLFPGSPAFLSKPALIFMFVWILLGIFYYLRAHKRLEEQAI